MFTSSLRRCTTAVTAVAITATMVLLGGVINVPLASAAQAPVGLGTAASYAVLAGSTVTNTGPTTLSGSLGLSPGSSVTGSPTVTNGSQQIDTPAAVQAKNDLTTAYNTAAAAPSTNNVTGVDLAGHTYTQGVYTASSSMALNGALTLSGNASAVFIFQAGTTLITGSGSTVNLIGGALACNVFWQVGTSATLGTNTTFVGTIMASASATLVTGSTVHGRVLAQSGAVTLDTNTITESSCATGGTTTATPSGTNQGGGGGSGSNAKGTGVNGNGLGGGGSNGNGLGSGVVPFGSPSTGFGGASHSGDPVLVAIGGIALMGAAVTIGLAFRRRRALSGGTGPDDLMSDGGG